MSEALKTGFLATRPIEAISKLFITSLFITEYSLSNINLQRKDLFPFSIKIKFIITEFLLWLKQFGDQVKVFCMNRYLSHLIRRTLCEGNGAMT